MLAIRNLSFSLGGRVLFDGATAAIPGGRKVGIVGRNGTGKTTLFRLIEGALQADGGVIETPRGFSISGVAQEAPAGPESLLGTVLAADAARASLLADAETATDPGRIADIQNRLAEIGAHTAEARASTILAGLGFDQAAQARPCAEFSGGWRMRVALAGVLFAEPDLLLLDEPTNYLDLEGALWLEGFLAKYPRTALIVSHDRELLNRSVDGILHLANRKLTYYAGVFDQFDTERRMKQEQLQSMKRRQDAQRAHIQSFVDRFRYKATKARQAQARIKMLERMQPIASLSESPVAPFTFPQPVNLPSPILSLDKAAAGYDGVPVLSGLDLRLDAEERIALLGANGEGKSTLAKLLAGRLHPMSGRLTKSSKLGIGYFAQHQMDELDPQDSAYQHMARALEGEPPARIRGRLAAVGIGAEIFENPVSMLSGGQKSRLLLALASIDAPQLLILDEPINHLDIESREALVHALNDYAGAVILISHDAHLIETVADRLWLVKDGRVVIFDGDIADYRRMMLSERAGKPAPGKAKPKRGANIDRKKGNSLRAEVRSAEKRMAELEAEKKAIEESLSDPNFYRASEPGEYERLNRKFGEIRRKLGAEEERWMAAQDKLDNAEAV
ncbi:MAG: ABC-F family ATP-binding cassette domain-containing protein [Rhodospirillales bacterium]